MKVGDLVTLSKRAMSQKSGSLPEIRHKMKMGIVLEMAQEKGSGQNHVGPWARVLWGDHLFYTHPRHDVKGA
jgi:hypothetical protein